MVLPEKQALFTIDNMIDEKVNVTPRFLIDFTLFLQVGNKKPPRCGGLFSLQILKMGVRSKMCNPNQKRKTVSIANTASDRD